MKPKQVANWLKTNLERMTGIMELPEITNLRKRIEDEEVIKERNEKREI